MSDCDAARETAQACLDGELTPQERSGVEAHLAACPACRQAAARYRPLFAALDAPAIPAPPANLAALVLKRVAAAQRRRQALQTWVLAAAVLIVAGAAALLAGNGLPVAGYADVAALATADAWSAVWPGVAAVVEGSSDWLSGLLAAAPGGAAAVAAVFVMLALDILLAYHWRFLARPTRANQVRALS